jgi:hypothetical protein
VEMSGRGDGWTHSFENCASGFAATSIHHLVGKHYARP